MKLVGEILINNSEAVEFSKCGNYLAFGSRKRLTIINVESSEIISTFSCTNEIKALRWHNDSDLILCVLSDDWVEVFSLSGSRWVYKYHEGMPGLKNAVWSPNNYYILMLAMFNVRILVWSLKTRAIMACISHPVLHKDNFSFSPDGDYYAVITRKHHNYKIQIYSTSTWILHKEIPCTSEILYPSSPLWSPTNLHIAIWDTVFIKTAFLEVYSVCKGEIDGIFKKTEPYEIYGICEVVWMPSGQFILLGCHDECIHVLNCTTWEVVTVLQHSRVIEGQECKIFEEMENEESFNLIKQRPVTLTELKQVFTPITATLGINIIKCDHSGNYVATKCYTKPAALWIWEVATFSLKALILLRNDIANVAWSFTDADLLICSKASNAVLWRSHNIVHIKCLNVPGRCLDNCSWCPNKNDKFYVISGSSMSIVRDFDK